MKPITAIRLSSNGEHKRRPMRRRLPSHARRGVLLLMILSMLVLFVLIGMTFILTASQFKRASVMRSRSDRFGDSPQQLIEIAIHQMLRDTNGRGSAAYGHSLLRDLYGVEGFRGEITANNGLLLDGQQLEIIGQPTDATQIAQGTAFYNGCVVTFVTGQASGQSARIMRYERRTNGTGVEVEIGVETTERMTIQPSVGDQFVVNGRPLNGVGIGYDGANLTQTTSLGPFVALQPNLSQFVPADNPVLAMVGGMDEGYDIADYQNLFLAWVPADRTRQQFTATVPEGSVRMAPSTHIIPSFHRPSIIRYWQEQNGNPTDWTYSRQASLRPIGPQVPYPDQTVNPTPVHLNFNGGIPFDPVHGPWDVDNDANGIADSVWIDLGVPVQLNDQGTLVKPLYAILCVDLDGRVNVNASGTLVQAIDDAVPQAHGEGYGPAEIRLSRPVGSLREVMSAATAANVMQSRYMGIEETTTSAAAGRITVNDDAAYFKFKNFLLQSEYNPSNVLNYLMPIDPVGRAVWTIDTDGQPLVSGVTELATTNAYVDDPYEVNLSSPNGEDHLYVAADLESLLRFYDADSYDVSQRLKGGGINAGLVTTHSFEVSAPPSLPSPELRMTGGAQPNGSFLDLVNARWGFDPALVDQTLYKTSIQLMYPFELLHGQKVNLNRLLGDGLDNNSNGIVDEPSESDALEPNLLNDYGAALGVSPNNKLIPQQARYRQMFARHLYCLARTLVDATAAIDHDGDGVGSPAETTQALAQWAINIVDFRDGDSIMTPFEYDTDISNGWNVDGDLSTSGDPDRGVVWGCERPELLITETLAWHDRRTKDTNQDPSAKLTTDAIDPDMDFDQEIRPAGAFFVELFNPWSSQIDRKPRSLYQVGQSTHVDLGRRAADGAPTWRLLTSADVNDNPDDPTYVGTNDQRIYFVNTSTIPLPAGLLTGSNFSSSTGDLSRIQPGHHAVIGSAGRKDGNKYVSICSAPTSDDPETVAVDTCRRIELQTPRSAAVALREPNDVAVPIPAFGTVIVDQPQSLSISEGDYSAFDGTMVFDIPLDSDPTAPLAGLGNGNHRTFRVVHLQRLADPTQAYDPSINPYRTIDSAYVDLNVFNSLKEGGVDDPSVAAAIADSFHAAQRGDATNQTKDWLYRIHDPGASPDHAVPGDGSLGYDTTLLTTLGQRNTGYLAGTQFPWLTWNNRPYISELELLNVPRTSSFQLPRQFGVFRTPVAGLGRLNFPHLFDLFGKVPEQGGLSGLERILEYVHVPSRFLGTEKWYSETAFSAATAAPEAAARRLGANYLSRFRDPGKVNLNTITDATVWDAIAAAYPSMYGQGDTDFWSNLLEKSIRVPGYDRWTPGSHLDPTLPTQFPRPFRPSSTADLGPLDGMREQVPSRSGLLRDNPNPALAETTLFAASTTTPDQDMTRSAYFYHRGMQRLANMTTEQSNVFAIWVTVGYFEVEPWLTDGSGTYVSAPAGGVQMVDSLHPEGYMFGREAGSDTGQAERHRSFYIIDRSLPVAFEPGRNHNVDQTILLRRHLD